ncbi:MAG: M28 family peptidase [Bacteroidota bacterium]
MKQHNQYIYIFISLVSSVLLLSACGNETPPSTTKQTDTATTQATGYQQASPNFNADSAYYFVQKQVDFGPRVTGTKESIKCAAWLSQQFKNYGAKVTEQKGQVTNWAKSKLNCINIIAQFNPEAKKRILITAHWDSRPVADNDPVESNRTKPVLAADDGGSGVAVMLEIARVIKQNKLNGIGVDLICFDAEDWGNPSAEFQDADTYCLGTQYWGQNIVPQNYTADFAINLDMVGGKDAKFIWEQHSINQGENVLRKVWEKAALLNYGNFFYYYQYGQITDDHFYVHKYTKIPAIDIINFNKETGFPAWWHTVNDNMSNIDRATLKAVGQTVLEVIYTEK